MTDDNYDMFDVDETPLGGLGRYTGRVVSSIFDTDEEYAEGEALLLQWELELTGLVDSDEDPPFETRKISFSCGKDWESLDGGTTAAHTSGDDGINWNKNTRTGMLMHRAFYNGSGKPPVTALPSDQEEEIEVESLGLREHFIENGFTPFDATAWEGLEFNFREETRDYGKKIGWLTFEMPYELVGGAETEEEKPKPRKQAAKKGGAKKQAARKRKAQPKEEESPEPIDVDKIKEQLLDHDPCGEATEYAEFLAAAYAFIEGLSLDESDPGHTTIMEWLEDEDEGAWSEYED